MSIKYRIIKKDKKYRKDFQRTELQRRYLKFMRLQTIKQPFIKLDSRTKESQLIKYQKLLGNLPKTRFKNFCLLSGRGRGVYRDFKISRHQIKSNFQFLTGLRSSSW